MKRNIVMFSLLGTLCIGLISFSNPARSQSNTEVDLSGNWSADNSTDEGMDAPDEPLPGNWAGIPHNASGRALALSYDSAQLAEPYLGLQCGYPPVYMMLGPFGLRVSNLTESNNGTTVAWRVGGWVDRGPITIWMDGRAEPSEYAPHPRNGFATGEWVNGMLQAHVTHMPAGISKRNGSPLSDRATMTLWFIRHGDELTVLARIVDPVYLSQPFLLTRAFLHYLSAPRGSVGEPCVLAYEGVAPDAVPFYLPGKNPLRNIVPETYGIPFSAELAGAASMYPSFRKVLRKEYRRPASCQDELKYQTFPQRVCGGPNKRLVDRSSRRFALTEEGAFYRDRAVQILAEVDKTESEIAARAKKFQGQLRVGVPMEIGRRRMAPLIAQFSTRHPDIGIELVLSDGRLDVISDELDVLLHLDPPTDGNVVARKLLTSRRAICASPGYLASNGIPETPNDLMNHDCIRLVRGRRLFDSWSFREGGKTHEVRVRGRLSTNSAEVMHGWAVLGHGICFKALWDLEQDLRDGRLVELLVPYACEISLYATYATRNHVPPRIRAFIDVITSALTSRSTPEGTVNGRRVARAAI